MRISKLESVWNNMCGIRYYEVEFTSKCGRITYNGVLENLPGDLNKVYTLKELEDLLK